jgi:hypothetical protein
MRIEFQRSGGFAAPAMKRSATIDTKDLPEAERAHVASLVSAAESAPPPSGEPRPDAFSYKITIRDDSGGSRVLRVSDSSMPDSVRPLVDWLRGRATPGR